MAQPLRQSYLFSVLVLPDGYRTAHLSSPLLYRPVDVFFQDCLPGFSCALASINDQLGSLRYTTNAKQRAFEVPYQTTVENIIIDFAERLNKAFSGMTLFSLKLFETESNFVEWFADDQ